MTRKYAKAEPLYLDAINIRKRALGEKSPSYAASLNDLANLYKLQREYAKAGALYQQALDIWKNTREQNRGYYYGAGLSNLAGVFALQGEYAKAETLLRQALDVQKEGLGEDHPDYAKSLANLANVYCRTREYEKAEPLYREALAAQRKVLGEHHPDYLYTLNKLALLYRSQQDYAKAEPLYRQALEIRKRVLGDDHPDYAVSLDNLAFVYWHLGEYAKAQPLCRQALDIRGQALGRNHPDYAFSLHNLGSVHWYMGDYATAETLHRQALEIRKKVLGKDHPDCAESLEGLAAAYKWLGQFDRAEPLHRQALEIRKKALGEDHPDYLKSLSDLACLYASMGDYAKAEPLYRQVLEMHKRALGEDHSAYALSLNDLGCLYGNMRDYAKAEQVLRQAIEVYRKLVGENHPDYAWSLNSLATVYVSMGEYAKAEPFCRQALEIQKEALGENHPDYAVSLSNLASVHRYMGEYAKAETLQRQAIEVRKDVLGKNHPDCAMGLNKLALLYMCMGEWANAEAVAREAVNTETDYADGLLGLLPQARGMALRGRLCGCDPLLSVLRKMPQPRAAEAYAAVWRTRGLVSRTMAQRRKGIANSPQARELLARLDTAAQQLAQLTLATPKPDQREARQKRLAELNDQKERLEAELGGLSEGFRRSQQIAAAKPEDLVRLLPQDTAVLEFLLTTVWTPPPSGRGRLVVEDHYDVFVLRRGEGPESMKVTWVQLGPAGPIDEALAQWRSALTGRPRPAPLEDGEKTGPLSVPLGEGRHDGTSDPEGFLREKIWDKIESHLAGCSTLIVIPDGELCFLPWAALPGREPSSCLLEDYAIATAPSAQQLYAALTEVQSPQGKLLLAGGVSYDAEPARPAVSAIAAVGKNPAAEAAATDLALAGKQPVARDIPERIRSPAMKGKSAWVALPGTEREIEDVRWLWAGGPEAMVLRGAAASETALRQQLPLSRYVHLATHGFFADPEFRSMFGHEVGGEQLFGEMEGLVTAARARVAVRNPLILSGVVLAGANLPPKTDELGLPTGEDGILTAEEIVNLDLRGTELVVLSACDTGLGSVASGEGVMGLARALHLAGARNVVASLWKVEDQTTAALMRLFYHKLWKEQKPPIVALREAQLYLYRHPERIGALANDRGFDFRKPAPLPEAGRKTPALATAPTRLWAAFILSGPGR